MPLFEDDDDRRWFLAVVAAAGERAEVCIYCYALMPNHYHLLLHGAGAAVAKFAQLVKFNYSQRFNRLAMGKGHVFQPRNNTKPFRSPGLALFESAYIHLNPQTDGWAERARNELWTSREYYARPETAPPWLDVGSILELRESISPRHANYDEYVDAVAEARAGLDIEIPDPSEVPPELVREVERTSRLIEVALSTMIPVGPHRDRMRRRLAYYKLVAIDRNPEVLVAAALGWRGRYVIYRARKQVRAAARIVQQHPVLRALFARVSSIPAGPAV